MGRKVKGTERNACMKVHLQRDTSTTTVTTVLPHSYFMLRYAQAFTCLYVRRVQQKQSRHMNVKLGIRTWGHCDWHHIP